MNNRPNHEERICLLLKLKTEAEKVAEAAITSAKASNDSVEIAKRSLYTSYFAFAISIIAIIVAIYCD